MSEEEQEVIEKLKDNYILTTSEQNKLANLIDRLQKENTILTYNYNNLKEERKDCIHKDKIKDKIDKIIKEHSEDLADKTLDLETKNIRTHQYNAMRDILEDLLKEN